MNLNELIKEISKQTDFSEKDIKTILQTALSIITEELQIGNNVTFRSYFSIHPTQVKGHTIKKENRRILIPRHTRYYFRLSKYPNKKR